MPTFTKDLPGVQPSLSPEKGVAVDYSQALGTLIKSVEPVQDIVDTGRLTTNLEANQQVVSQFQQDVTSRSKTNPYESYAAAQAVGDQAALDKASQDIMKLRTGVENGMSDAVAKYRLDALQANFTARFPHLASKFSSIRSNAAASVDAISRAFGEDKETETQRHIDEAVFKREEALNQLRAVYPNMARPDAIAEYNRVQTKGYLSDSVDLAKAQGNLQEPQAIQAMSLATSNIMTQVATQLRGLNPEQRLGKIAELKANGMLALSNRFADLNTRDKNNPKGDVILSRDILSNAQSTLNGLFDSLASYSKEQWDKLDKEASKTGINPMIDLLSAVSPSFKWGPATDQKTAGDYAVDIVGTVNDGLIKSDGELVKYKRDIESQLQNAQNLGARPADTIKLRVVRDLLDQPEKLAAGLMDAMHITPDVLNNTPYEMMGTEQKVIYKLLGRKLQDPMTSDSTNKNLFVKAFGRNLDSSDVFTPVAKNKYIADPEIGKAQDNYVASSTNALAGRLEFYGDVTGNAKVSVNNDAFRNPVINGKPNIFLAIDFSGRTGGPQIGNPTVSDFQMPEPYNYGWDRSGLDNFLGFVNQNAAIYSYMGQSEKAGRLVQEAYGALNDAVRQGKVNFSFDPTSKVFKRETMKEPK